MWRRTGWRSSHPYVLVWVAVTALHIGWQAIVLSRQPPPQDMLDVRGAQVAIALVPWLVMAGAAVAAADAVRRNRGRVEWFLPVIPLAYAGWLGMTTLPMSPVPSVVVECCSVGLAAVLVCLRVLRRLPRAEPQDSLVRQPRK
jgi:DMSO/TMAO reductase YedYZ heme-binding membrane subunit